MNKLLLFTFLVFPFISPGQDSFFKHYQVWSSFNGGPSGTFVLSDSSIITTFNFSFGFYMMKTDKNGLHVWAKLDSSSRFANRFYASQIVRCRDGNFLVSGSRYNNGSSSSNSSVLKIDTAGNLIWNKTYVNFFEPGLNIDTTRDGGFILTGYTHDTTIAWSPIYTAALKADSLGNVIWCKEYITDSLLFYEKGCNQTDDNGFLMVTNSGSIKVDSMGNVMYSNWFFNNNPYTLKSKLVRINKNSYAYIAFQTNFCLYDSTGKPKWKLDIIYKDVVRLSDSTFLLLSSESWIWPGTTIEVMDTSSSISSTFRYGMPYQIFPHKFSLMADGRYVVSGLIDEYQMQDYNLFIMKTMQNGYLGCEDFSMSSQHNFLPDTSAPFVVNSISLNCTMLEDTIVSYLLSPVSQSTLCYQLLGSGNEEIQNSISIFPNPAISNFTIHFDSQFQNADIEIFNLIGMKLYSVQRTDFEGQIAVDCEHFPPGLYFVKLQTEKGSIVEKLVIQK